MAVKLLFDQNLAPSLARALADRFPGSMHVRDLGLQMGDDEAIWVQAAANGFLIVTKDDDFRQRSFLHGHPPKVLWIRLGNCRTDAVRTLLRERAPDIERFVADAQSALYVLSRRR